MSVYIKGRKPPNSCDDCWVSDCPNDEHIDGYRMMDRPTYCPLIPVSDHGRLIDADALRCLYDPHDYGLDGEQADEYDRYHVSLPVIRQNIDDMPTIIPADCKEERTVKWREWNTFVPASQADKEDV